MTQINEDIAAGKLSELIDAVLEGEVVELTRQGEAVARLISIPGHVSQPKSTEPFPPLSEDVCVGMWANRSGMADSTEWLTKFREQEWKRE